MEKHRRALRDLVSHPDRLDVLGAKRSERQLNDILAAIAADRDRPEVRGRIGSLATVDNAVDMQLAPGQERLAARYLDRYGDAIRITLGEGHTYVPDGCGHQPVPERCPDLSGSDPTLSGLALEVVPDGEGIAAHEIGHATLVVRNLGRTRFSIDSGIPIIASLVAPGTTRVVARYWGAVAGVGGGVDLGPGRARRHCDALRRVAL